MNSDICRVWLTRKFRTYLLTPKLILRVGLIFRTRCLRLGSWWIRRSSCTVTTSYAPSDRGRSGRGWWRIKCYINHEMASEKRKNLARKIIKRHLPKTKQLEKKTAVLYDCEKKKQMSSFRSLHKSRDEWVIFFFYQWNYCRLKTLRRTHSKRVFW